MVIGLSPQAFGQPQSLGDAVPFLLVELEAAPGLDAQRRPRRVQAVGQALRVAHEAGRRGSSLTQTRIRSPAAHGPVMARACICSSNCSSTRSAVRRSASSRSAVRLAGEK